MTREEARGIIKSECYIFDPLNLDRSTMVNTALDMAIIALEQEPKTGCWIPCSERMPEENYAVLVWCPERKNTYCAYLEEGQWWIFGAYFEKVKLEVIAWMPLPEPYNAKIEVKKNDKRRSHSAIKTE